jgi:hypothetical protein
MVAHNTVIHPIEEVTMEAQKLNPLARAVAVVGGAVLMAAPFLAWAEAGTSSTSGWDVASATCVLVSITGLTALAAAITGGRIGFFRPDLSLNGAADILGVVSTPVVLWQLFDLPEGASPAVGIFAALAGAVTVMAACGDYRSLRGAPAFPRLGEGGGGEAG